MSQNATWEPKTARGQRILAWVGVVLCVLLGVNFLYNITHEGGALGLILLVPAIIITRNTFKKAEQLESNPSRLATVANTVSTNSTLITVLFFVAGIMVAYALFWLSTRLPSSQMTLVARLAAAIAILSIILSFKSKQIASTILFFCVLLTVVFAWYGLLNVLIVF